MVALEKLSFFCETIPPRLRSIQDSELRKKQAGKWSKIEILGHLIDSATNNHQRLVRSQIEHLPVVSYEQNLWVSCQSYQNENKDLVIDLWTSLNKHLVYLISTIPEDNLNREWLGATFTNPLTISFLIEDYVVHLEHHLDQIFFI